MPVAWEWERLVDWLRACEPLSSTDSTQYTHRQTEYWSLIEVFWKSKDPNKITHQKTTNSLNWATYLGRDVRDMGSVDGGYTNPASLTPTTDEAPANPHQVRGEMCQKVRVNAAVLSVGAGGRD